jgi:hypothetical protein
MNSLFKEKQKFKNPLLLVFLVIGIILPLIVIWNKIDSDESLEENIFENFGLIFLTAIIYTLLGLIYKANLKLAINQYGLYIKFYPFKTQNIDWIEVKQAVIVDCDFYSPFGINPSTKFGTAYNIRAKKGLHLILKNNKEIIVGTKRPKKLEKVIETYRNVHNFS